MEGLIVCRARNLQKAKQPSEEPGQHLAKLQEVEDKILQPSVTKAAQPIQEEHYDGVQQDAASASRVLPGAVEGVAVLSQDWTDACLAQAKECLQKLPQGGGKNQEDRLVQLCIILKVQSCGRVS